MPTRTPSHIHLLALEELRAEATRTAVDAEKRRLLSRKTFWSRVFPFTITITRKNP